MSRVGNRILTIPSDVNVEIKDNFVYLSGKLGKTKVGYDPKIISILQDNNTLVLKRNNDLKTSKSIHGTTNVNINNAIIGVSNGHHKKIKIFGVGYKAAVSGKKLDLYLGHSHNIKIEIPENVTIECPTPTEINIKGIDKAQIGLLAALIRSKRPPEPYKGKGVMYDGEKIVRKIGKSADSGKGGKK